MGLIRVLPETIANKIAAGEVIERPASIVKELIENSLDAQAASIELSIEHGGRSLIRVADDGTGMDPEDAKIAFERHATSKITALEDLEGIGSFGFRGEALPSIGAVSRTRLITRADGASAGVEIVVEGGRLLGVNDHPCRKGTIVEVRDLFFNTPARRKFLKPDATETAHILEAVHRLALAAPRVHFTVKSSGRTVLNLVPADRLLSRVTALLGDETGPDLLELDKEQEGIRVWGVIGKPALTRANRSGIHLFVNRRWIRSSPLAYALSAGYRGLIPHDRFPAAVLFIDLDLARVDVNVHPTKQEVRISNEGQVTAWVRQAIGECLGKMGDLAPRLKLPAGSSGMPERTYSLQTAPEIFISRDAPQHETITLSLPEMAAQTALQEPIALKDSLRVTKILGQIHNTFLVVETEEGFMVVDQHAAHERIVFEALLKQFNSERPERQMLLLEEALEVNLKHLDLFKGSIPFLSRIGFEVEEFGERTFLVRALPAVFGEVNAVRLLTTYLEEMEEGKVRTALDDHREALAALCACKKGSVKASESLSARAIQALLESLARCENPFACPHGRPVFFTQSLSDLEKQFKRK